MQSEQGLLHCRPKPRVRRRSPHPLRHVVRETGEADQSRHHSFQQDQGRHRSRENPGMVHGGPEGGLELRVLLRCRGGKDAERGLRQVRYHSGEAGAGKRRRLGCVRRRLGCCVRRRRSAPPLCTIGPPSIVAPRRGMGVVDCEPTRTV